jgi:PAS domain S-box-containing protein
MLNSSYERVLFRTLAEYMPQRIYAKDTEGRFVFANKAVAVGMGASCPEDLLGRTDFDFYPMHEATKYFAEERYIMETRVPLVNHEEHVHYTRSSSNAWMLTTKVPLLDECGAVIGIAGINHDITLRKEAEQALSDAKVQAEKATQAKTEFLAAMSHELRTPLNAVLGYATILQSDAGLSDQQAFALNTIERSGQHLLLLVNDLIDISRLESGTLQPCPTDVHLHDLLQSVGNIIRVKAAEKSLAFGCEIDPNLPPIAKVDGRRLSQVLLNLLSNAVKFTDFGEVWLRARCVSLDGSTVRIRFEVEDTGVGLRTDELRTIFEPYVQVGAARRRVEGVGLGLAISRQLVEALGGIMDVRSKAGEGSLFSFELSLPVEAIWRASIMQVAATDYVRLPEAEMRTLLLLAQSGTMREIGRFSARLTTLGSQYESLAETLTMLANQYASKMILDLVKRLDASSAGEPPAQARASNHT